MEERMKKISLENIYEDITTLKLKQHKIILKKKELNKKFELNRLMTSDNLKRMTHWDIILLQVKYLSLDVFEERKWKKGISYIISNEIASKVKKLNKKKKFDELYKKCMCLYLSINVNNNLTDISMGKENKNISEELINRIKSITDEDDYFSRLSNWKDSLIRIKLKLQKKFGERNSNQTKNVLKVIDLMDDMINLQVENVKRIKLIKEEKEKKKNENEIRKINQNNFSNDMSSFIHDIDLEMCNYEKLNQVDDHLIFIQNNYNNLDLNKISKELSEVMEMLVNELDNKEFEENEIFLNVNSNIKLPTNESKIEKINDKIFNDKIYDTNIEKITETSPGKFTQNDIISLINPKQLFYNSSNQNNTEELKINLEKIFKLENEKVEILPNYNYREILNKEIDINKDLDEYSKIYFKVFPDIFFHNSNQIDKEILENEIEIYRTKYDRILKDSEYNKLFNFKFSNITHIQKLILLWGLCQYGNNLNILSEIPNIFSFSKSIHYDNEEISILLDKILEEFNCDFLASNFDGVIRNSSRNYHHYIFNLDPPMLNSAQCNFYYNKKMLDFVKDNHNRINNTENMQCYPMINFTLKNKQNLNYSDDNFQNLQKINFIINNPIFIKSEIKQNIYKSLKEDIKKICNRVENLFENSVNNYLSIDFQNMARKVNNTIPTVNIGKSTRRNSQNGISNNINTYNVVNYNNLPKINNEVNKEKIINNLMTNKTYDFSMTDFSNKSLENTKTNLRQDPLEGVSFYSQQSIQREWENLRSPWYQNNTQFKPKFRKPCKNLYFNLNFNLNLVKPQQQNTQQQMTINTSSNNSIMQSNQNFNMVKNLNDNRPDK